MQKLRKFLDHVIQLERYICCALLVAIMVICFGAVIMRYVVSKPWSWSEEVIIVMLVWFGFMVMSVETYNDSNIAITVLGGALMFAFSIINLIGVFVKEERQTSDGVERFEKGFDKLFNKKGGKKS